MKRSQTLNKAFFILIALLISLSINTNAQDQKNNKKENEQTEIQNLVQSKNFVFVAQYASPLGGRQINLTSPYDLRISADTVLSELPYFGRAYVAPINPTEGGFHFTSTKFNYTSNPRKKGGWDITILPKDNQDVRQMLLNVTEDGYATLQVISNNRQAISYNGYITSKEKFR